MPLFDYECQDCKKVFEVLVMPGWDKLREPILCVSCSGSNIVKLIANPSFRLDGKKGLRTVPDPTPPLQKLKEQGPRPGCEGGYKDLPDFKPTERRRGKHGNWEWGDKKRQYFH